MLIARVRGKEKKRIKLTSPGGVAIPALEEFARSSAIYHPAEAQDEGEHMC